MPYTYLKMETIKSVLNLITSNCYMANIGIKNFLKFSLQGKLYKFTYLSNRLCSGSREFTKLLKPH